MTVNFPMEAEAVHQLAAATAPCDTDIPQTGMCCHIFIYMMTTRVEANMITVYLHYLCL